MMTRYKYIPLCLLMAGQTMLNAQTPTPTPEAVKAMIDVSSAKSAQELGISETSGQVQTAPAGDATAPGVTVKIAPGGESYPGIHIKPPEPWNLSDFGHVQARITNTGTLPVTCNLRVDGKSTDGSWGSNTETTTIKPGESGEVKVYFGYSYGRKPGAKLDTSAIHKLVLFTHKAAGEQSFRIDAIEAGGPAGEKPPINPNDIRIAPADGLLLGNGVVFEEKQIEANGGAVATMKEGALQIEFPKSQQAQWVSIKPPVGRWDLREGYGVTVKFKNLSANPASLRVRVNSNAGPTDLVASAPVAPDTEGEVEVPFAPAVSWQGVKDSIKTSWTGQANTGTKFISDAASSITFSVENDDDGQAMQIISVKLGKLKQLPIPDWVGKRPPIDGDWVMTFDENFDGDAIDTSKWNMYTENFWDKRSHFSKDNVLVGNGVVRLHYEKKTGFHNDDPNLKKTDYATGFLDTYGKWVQRYGYFEARMKLTSAPGLWPAFWLMPDRGPAAGPQWKRASTDGTAMEFDIMEFLGRWGPYRYNIAMHWNGYGKGHQQTGTTNIYFQPDKDGFITAGLLWLPGLAVFYANGKEVARWESPRISDVESDIMFTNVTGGWDNNAIDDSKFPDDFVIDYVRAWQRKDLMSEKDTAFQANTSPTPTPQP